MLQYRLMNSESTAATPARNPKTEAAFRRQVRLQIYLPLGIGVLSVAGLGIGLGVASVGTASAWADITLIYLLMITLVLGLVLLILVGGLAFGVGWVLTRLPAPAMQVQALFVRVERIVRRGADAFIRPLLVVRSVLRAVVDFWSVR